ncbi:MAG: SDR family oxidoreductase [Proteobacteria bacterium]|nr:SDR family oxidoreductase [Pseudomonadota bacterium]MBI3496367.1 SDR family oxidoreductase [Pseudomonadota bacterium]
MLEIFSLKERVALVTGASHGLGAAMAEGLARAGAHVVMNARGAERLQTAVRALKDAGLSVSASPFDTMDAPAARAALERIKAEHGRLDILINNAAYGVPKNTLETSDGEWSEILNVALTSCVRLSRQAVPMMAERRWGRIIMISSINARIVRGTNTAYVAAKAGLEGLTRAMASEFAEFGINVNAIAPGYIATNEGTALRTNPQLRDWIAGRTVLKRWGRAAELAGAAVFLASEAASYTTGHVLTVDGGMSIAI